MKMIPWPRGGEENLRERKENTDLFESFERGPVPDTPTVNSRGAGPNWLTGLKFLPVLK